MLRPKYFVTTGFPKSGTTWFETLLFDLPQIGGYRLEGSDRLPAVYELLFQEPGLRQLARQLPGKFEGLLQLLLDPSCPRPSFTSDQRTLAEGALRRYAVRARTIYDVFSDRKAPAPDDTVTLLASVLGTHGPKPPRPAYGCPAKHLKPSRLRAVLPHFDIVRIIRDPRDVLISFFYHDVGGHLTEPLLSRFVRTRGTRLEPVADWKRSYFGWRLNQLLRYYLLPFKIPDRTHTVRYENLLNDPVQHLCAVLDSLGVPHDTHEIAARCDRRSFSSVTGGTVERRNSFIRAGSAGDWRNYFDRNLVRALGRRLSWLLCFLGYESNEYWLEQVPDVAPKAFEFSRFRLMRTTSYRFLKLWQEDGSLQRRYPYPFDFSVPDNFFTYLDRLDEPSVQAWLTKGRSLQSLWQTDVVEDQFH